MAAVDTSDITSTLRQGMGAVQADALADWMVAVESALSTIAAASGAALTTAVSAIITD